MSSNPPSKFASAAAANPDSDDDYDDLDDAIPELSTPSPPPPPPPAPAAGPPHSGAASDVGDDEDDNPDDAAFAAELAKGMEHLLRELSGAAVPLSEENPLLATSASASGVATPALEGNDGGKEAREIQEAWERVFKQAEGSSSSDKAGAGAGAGAGAAGSAKGGDDFQRTVKETMERLKRSAETSKNDASAAEDPLAALLASLGDASGAGGPGGLGGLDDEGVLESMMDGLMSKEVLYESMKELDLKYPPYLTSPEAAKLEPSAKHAYEGQAKLVAEIVETFEKPSYSDKDEACKAEIRELMGKMQDLGSPPKEVMGEMPEGFELGPDGLPNLSGLPGGGPDGDCVIC